MAYEFTRKKVAAQRAATIRRWGLSAAAAGVGVAWVVMTGGAADLTGLIRASVLGAAAGCLTFVATR